MRPKASTGLSVEVQNAAQRLGIVRIVRLDRHQPLHGDQIDRRIGADDLADFGKLRRLHADGGPDIERILAGEARIDHGRQLRAGFRRERRHLGALVAGVVEHEALGAAGVAGHGDAIALRQAALAESERRFEQIVERRTAHDAVLPADRVEHLIVGGDRAGVARGRRLAAFAAPDLQQDDRLRRP